MRYHRYVVAPVFFIHLAPHPSGPKRVIPRLVETVKVARETLAEQAKNFESSSTKASQAAQHPVAPPPPPPAAAASKPVEPPQQVIFLLHWLIPAALCIAVNDAIWCLSNGCHGHVSTSRGPLDTYLAQPRFSLHFQGRAASIVVLPFSSRESVKVIHL